mgnify:CR=1 FL=1
MNITKYIREVIFKKERKEYICLYKLEGELINEVEMIASSFIAMGHDAGTALGMAQGKIYGQLIQQSTLCAFINAYKIYAVLILILIPMVFLLKKFQPEQG